MKKYTLLTNFEEPTDQQLSDLMHEVAKEAQRRVMQGGHDVPITKIISRYSKSIANCCIASKIVDRAYIYDNSVEFAEPTLLFRVIDGILTKEYTTTIQWAKPMLDFIKTS